MIVKKINDQILNFYVKSKSEKKYARAAFASYVLGVFVLIETTNHAATAAGGDLIEVVTRMFNDLAGTILRLSTAAALIGVGTGAFFKKLSFGKPDRMETGNKMIVNSIWGWVLINGLTTILRWAGGYLDSQPVITWMSPSAPITPGIESADPSNLPTDLIIGE